MPNRLLDLCDDELVIEAVDLLERQEDAWSGARQEHHLAKMREKTKF